MASINELIHYCYDQGWSSKIYSAIVIVAFAAQMLFLIFYRKKYNISLLKTVIAVVLIYSAGYFWMLVLTWIENGFKNWGANNIVRLFVYMPLICMAVSKLLKEPALKLCDFIGPSMALQHVIGHSVCPFAGCCHGYPSSWGFWNPTSNRILFPIQWIECLVALAIMIWLLKQARKENYQGSGKIYAMLLVSFGYTRFILEFFRNNTKLVLGISNLAFHALFMALVGTVWLMVLHEREKENKRKAELHQHSRRK